MFPQLKIFHRGLILVGLPFVISLALVVCLAMLLYQSDQEQMKESTYRKIAAVNARMLILTAEIPYYLITSIQYQSNEVFQIYQTKYDESQVYQARLMELLRKTPDLSDGAEELQKTVDGTISLTKEIADARKSNLLNIIGKLNKVFDAYNNQKQLAVDRLAKMLRAGEIRTAEIEKQQALIRYRQSQIMVLGLLANVAAGIFLAVFFRQGIARRLNTIKQNTILLSDNKPLQAALKGADEIAQLDRAFHLMDQELKLAAMRERELFDNASDVICVLDYSNKFVKVNRASQRCWGYPPNDLLNMTLDDIMHPDDMNAMLDHIANGKLTGEAFIFENRIFNSAKDVVEASWSSYWSQIDRLLYCVVHDISQRKRTERMKKKFLSMLSSDLKRPLSTMSGAVAILLDSMSENLSKNATDKLKVAGKNLQRLLGLVNDLLQVAEMESSSVDIKKEWCDTEELLVRSMQEVEAVADKQGIKIVVESCQVQWLVDPNRIVQVLVNLLSNAIKFSPPGETVTLSAEQSGDMIEVRVRDRGRGVPASHKEAIFEKFKQVEAADGKRKSGTGLGLPICKQIVEDHGGSIGVISAENEGSTFYFQIPRDESVSLKMKLQKRKLAESETRPGGELAETESDRVLTAQKLSQSGTTKPKHSQKAGFSGQLKLGYKGAVLVGVPLLFELALVGATSSVLMQVDHERKEELHYRNIAFMTSRLMNTYFMMAVGAISDSEEKDWLIFREAYNTACKTLKDLEVLLKDDPVGSKHLIPVKLQDRKVAAWVHNGDKYVEEHGRNHESYKNAMGGKEKMLPTIIKLTRKLEVLCDDSEKKEFVSPRKQKQLRLRQAQILAFGLLANVTGSLALALFFASDIKSRLQILADNAMRLAKEKTLNAQLIGSDEIAELDRIFHNTAQAIAEARKKERAVFDNSQDVICAIGKEGVFQSINPAAATLWGFTKEELIGKRLEDLIVADDREKLKDLFSMVTDGHIEIELRVSKKDGSMMHGLWSGSRASEQGEIFCVVHDITNLKELEQIKHEFLAMVSHDLRTPLTSILGITKLILAGAFGAVEERPERMLNRISKSGDQLLELINDLLDIEKLEAGEMQLVQEEVDLLELLQKAAEGSKDRSKIAFDLDDSIPRLSADRDRLVQAITNVLNHSIDQSVTEGSVTISCRQKADAIEMTITDCAPTLPEEQRETLFDRFKTSPENGSETAASSGNGLRLAIAKKIIESHGGQIDAIKPDNISGNKISIHLPRKALKP